jgi:glycosyltransferase involved in cell wall biosynthesis
MTAAARTPIDVLMVSLGTTLGLRAADDQLVEFLRDCGLRVELVRAELSGDIRTLALTDLVQARACARAARTALAAYEPTTIIYGTTTAALLWPRPGAIRFDALAQRTRPGRHGLWQRAAERRRLAEASLLLPQSEASLAGAPERRARSVVVPIAVEPAAHDQAADEAVDALLAPLAARSEHAIGVTYAADPVKKGLDRVVGAWHAVRRDGEVLLIAGHGDLPAQVAGAEGIVDVGRLPREVFRALVRAVGLLVTAPRREDYGLVQLEALAEGARVVTTAAPGPYAALPLVRVLWPEQVVDDPDDLAALGRAIRFAVDARPDPVESLRATQAVAPWARDAVVAELREQVVPALLGAAPAADGGGADASADA